MVKVHGLDVQALGCSQLLSLHLYRNLQRRDSFWVETFSQQFWLPVCLLWSQSATVLYLRKMELLEGAGRRFWMPLLSLYLPVPLWLFKSEKLQGKNEIIKYRPYFPMLYNISLQLIYFIYCSFPNHCPLVPSVSTQKFIPPEEKKHSIWRWLSSQFLVLR